MTLKSDVKFKEKLTCDLENDMRNMANEKCELKIHREVMCHDNEE